MFREGLLARFEEFRQTLATDAGHWTVKGFIDLYRNVYTISLDTTTGLKNGSLQPEEKKEGCKAEVARQTKGDLAI